jgi:hypothetical protein
MALTYVALATVTVGSGGAANIEFTSIPGTYTDLVLKASLRDTRNGVANDFNLEINGSSANRTYKALNGNGSTTSSFGGTSATIGVETGDTSTASTFGSFELYIPNYAGSNNKSMSSDSVQENNGTQGEQWFVASLWSQTSAITSLKLVPGSGFSYKQHSTATLYGIKNTV